MAELFVRRRAILTNPDLRPSTPWQKLLENDFWGTPLRGSGSHGSYRPLCVATFRLNYIIGGLEPLGYHVVNVVLHAICSALVVRVARKVSNYDVFFPLFSPFFKFLLQLIKPRWTPRSSGVSQIPVLGCFLFLTLPTLESGLRRNI